MDYSGAFSLLGSKDTYKLKSNTSLEREDGYIALRFHATSIIKFFPDRSIKIRNGGYQTVTTKDRLNEYLNSAVISTRDGNWVITVHGTEYLFEDGMVIASDYSTDATPYVVYELDRNADTKINTLDDAKQLIEDSTLKALKVLWRKCKFSRKIIAYYASLEFIPLIIPTAAGDEYWYSTATSRLAIG